MSKHTVKMLYIKKVKKLKNILKNFKKFLKKLNNLFYTEQKNFKKY